MKKIIVIILCLIFTGYSHSQSGGLNLTLAFPMGEFKENVDRLGFGASGHLLFFGPNEKMPFGVGLNVGYLNYGSESRREPFSPTIPDVVVDVDRTNNLMNFHILFQVAPSVGRFRPYVEGLFGGAYIFTETTIRSRGEEEVASSTNFDDWAWSYGGGGGIMFQITDEPTESISSLFIDLKVRYLFGSEAEYLKEGSVIINNGQVYYAVSESKTDLLTVHAGVTAFFSAF